MGAYRPMSLNEGLSSVGNWDEIARPPCSSDSTPIRARQMLTAGRRSAGCGVSALLLSGFLASADAASLKVLHRFTDTGNSTPSRYALGAEPYSELLQASDGNFYGTTVYGGSGLCPNNGTGGVLGCGTVFRMTPQGKVTTLYSFPYDTGTSSAPNGAFPTAGLIQATDGNLYGVAQDGGVARCNGVLGCGTLFRISTAGTFKLLHQFCSGDGCANPSEGGRPMAHLVQLPNTSLCGTTQQGGFENDGTLFCATTGGSVTTEYVFEAENGTDGLEPDAALLVGADGKTLYGTAPQRGANGGGVVFAFKTGTMTILQALSTCSEPTSALIFGADGKLYGTTTSGGSDGGCIFSLNTDGTGFEVKYSFGGSSNAPGEPDAGLVLARDGMMYGTTHFGSIERGFNQDNGIAYRYNPANGAFKALADFTAPTGDYPRAALIEGADNYLYTTTPADGGSNARGQDQGTVVRLSPALKK